MYNNISIYIIYKYIWGVKNMTSFSDIWDAVCSLMKQNKFITEAGFNMWLNDSYIMDFKNGVFYISVPTDFHKKIASNTYTEKLKECFCNIMGTLTDIEFVINKNDTRGVLDEDKTNPSAEHFIGSEFTFENFFLGSSNRYAHAAAMSVSENPTTNFINPLLIYGTSGVGKTHLMFAIRNRILKLNPHLKIEYIRCEDFGNMFIESLQSGTINLFHNRFRTTDVLLIDDIQFLEGKIQMQEEMFNTFNALHQAKKQIVLTSDRAPKDINKLDDRLRSRFESGVMADISSPDYETRVGIISMKTKALGISLDDDIVNYIADQVKTNTRQIEGIINQINAYINLHNASPSISVVQSYISNISKESLPDPITVRKVVSEVSRFYNISESEIMSRKRAASIVWARQACFYIVSKITNITNMQMSREFKMDHTTIGYAINKVEDKLKIDSYEKRNLEEIMENLLRNQG